MAFDSSGEIRIDEKKLNQMKLNIITLELENLKTKAKTNDEMVEAIRRIISDEVKKNY
ncbi:MAG: hypothetical protein WBI44_02285 [Syntrophaceticus sp.]